MKSASAYRYYRRASNSGRSSIFKKDQQAKETFFPAPSSDQSFFRSASALQRKCADCEGEKKEVNRKESPAHENEVDGSAEGNRELHAKLELTQLNRAEYNEKEQGLSKKESATPALSPASTEAYVHSLNGSGQTLPKHEQQFFGERMDADFSEVKIHTGTEAEHSAAGVNAKAYTVDNHIVFNKEQYNSSSSEGRKLLAHELTHVVQNSRGAAKAEEISDSDNSTKLQRRKGESSNAHVGGEPGNVTFLDDGAGDVIGPGEGGFSRRALQETSGRSQDVFDSVYAIAVHPSLVIQNDQIETDKKIRSRQKQWALDQISGWGPQSVRNSWAYRAARCQENMDTMDRHKREEDQKTFAYNAWVPTANSFYVSMSRLEALQDMLGVNSPVQMVNAITQELANARGLGMSAQLQSDKGVKGVASIPVPPMDNTVAQASAQTTIASRDLNEAYLGFQQHLMSLEIQKTQAEGDKDRARLGDINEVKTFVRNVGKTVDLTMSVVRGAPAAITNVTNRVQQAGATLNAARNRRQILAGQRPTYNPTYVTVNDSGQMVVRNMQTLTETTGDRDSSGKMIQTPAPDSGLSLPTSVSEILGTITDFAYASEVREINNRLQQIQNRCDSITQSQETIRIKQVTVRFMNALNSFAQKCNDLQRRLAQRREDYLNFGKDLDNFARQDASARKKGLAPGKNQERYATVMLITSQVREALSIGDSAKGSFDSLRTFYDWVITMKDERLSVFSAGNRNSIIEMKYTESHSLWEMYYEVKRFHDNINKIKNVLNPIAESGAQLFAALHQGGGDGGSY